MPTKIKALLTTAPKGQKVTVQGWVRTFRANRFIALNDGSTLGNLQCVVDFEKFDENTLKNISTGAALKVTGNYVESQGKGQTAEIQVEEIHIYGSADPDTYPIQPKKHSFEFLREKAHLRVRTATFSAVMRVRAALSFAVHQFFQKEGFHYVNTPIITGSDAEGAGEMFRVSTLDPKNPTLDESVE
ncbi:MAG: OB-fold nucleic acid binding domain-containing protein, partial [Flavobacteriaceae bacterium]